MENDPGAQVTPPVETQDTQQALQPDGTQQPRELQLTQTNTDPPTGSEETQGPKETMAKTPSQLETAISKTGQKTRDPKGAYGNKTTAIVPVSKAQSGAVAKARPRDNFSVRVKQIFQAECYAAAKALETGIYIGWRCPEYTWDCFRLGDGSKCFCGHLLKEHQSYTGTSVNVPCAVKGCHCRAFSFIPSCPEEVGEMWMRKKTGFDAQAWRAKCRCKHSHEEHRPTGIHACHAKDCRCQIFESNFLCGACDRKWEAHQTFFETTLLRKKANLPYGDDYLPFAEMPYLQKIVLAGEDDDDGKHKSLVGGLQGNTSRSRALPFPCSGPWNSAQEAYRKSGP